MSARIPRDAEMKFIETLATGTVHLYVLPPDDEPGTEPIVSIPMDGSGRALAELLGTPAITRCGQRTFPYSPCAGARHGWTYRFDDALLCAACYRTLHPDDQERAFEHEQPEVPA